MSLDQQNTGKHRLYNDLSWLWPFWGGVEEYALESELFSRLIKQYARIPVKTLLDVGCGGGKNVFNLKKHFTVTGLDISDNMLENAKVLNPDCEFVKGDMRNYKLGRRFDSIFLNDSIAYMTSKEDLLATFQNAFKHLNTGGVLICYVETVKGKLGQNRTDVTKSTKGDIEIVFIENYYDPNPNDDMFDGLFVYIIRENGKLRVETDFHELGIFELDYWRDALQKAGFNIHELSFPEENFEETVFVCISES